MFGDLEEGGGGGNGRTVPVLTPQPLGSGEWIFMILSGNHMQPKPPAPRKAEKLPTGEKQE